MAEPTPNGDARKRSRIGRHEPVSFAHFFLCPRGPALRLFPLESPVAVAALLLLSSLPLAGARAEPWLAPGNVALRHDIELLADAGVLSGPVTTWPVSWPDVDRDIAAARLPADADPALRQAFDRVRHAAREASRSGFSGIGVRAAASKDPDALRTFAADPREEGEFELNGNWMSGGFAANLAVTGAVNPVDGQELRFDDTYIGYTLGNFMFSAGWMDRWWGPGWEGSLILGTNARPIPSLRIERNYTDPFESKWLRWIGNWRASLEVGRLEGSDVPVPDVNFFAARVNFRPLSWLELGLSRTAQWCGEGRPCGWDVFWDMLIGRDNEIGEDGGQDDQAGNQMAGYDFRLRSPWSSVPVALYGQFIGEDEAGMLPAKFLGQGGIETWFGSDWGGARVHLEYADTTCDFASNEPLYGCAYTNALYPQGYTYRGRTIGHSMGGDGRMLSMGAVLVRPGGDSLTLLVRDVDLARGSDAAHGLRNAQVQYNREFAYGQLRLGAGYNDYETETEENSSGFTGFLEWRYGY